MVETKVSSLIDALGKNRKDLDGFCYTWFDLYMVEKFIWIGSCQCPIPYPKLELNKGF
jgi:hypothetical protein